MPNKEVFNVLSFQKMIIKTTVRFCPKQVRMAKINKRNNM